MAIQRLDKLWYNEIRRYGSLPLRSARTAGALPLPSQRQRTDIQRQHNHLLIILFVSRSEQLPCRARPRQSPDAVRSPFLMLREMKYRGRTLVMLHSGRVISILFSVTFGGIEGQSQRLYEVRVGCGLG